MRGQPAAPTRPVEATTISTERAATPRVDIKTLALATATALVATALAAAGISATDAHSWELVLVH